MITEAEVLHLTTKYLRLSDFTKALNELIKTKESLKPTPAERITGEVN